MRTLRRIVLAVLIGILLLVGSLYVYIFRLGGLERIVNAQVASLVEQRYDLEVTIGNVKGDFFSGLVLEDMTDGCATCVIDDEPLPYHQLNDVSLDEQVIPAGFIAKYKAPPPKKGSIYLP